MSACPPCRRIVGRGAAGLPVLGATRRVARALPPRCGEGRLFRGFLGVRPRCEVCGLDFGAQDSGDGPAAFIILIVGFLAVGGLLITEVAYQPPVWVHLVVWLPLALILVLALLRPFKATLIALQYKYRRHEFGDSR